MKTVLAVLISFILLISPGIIINAQKAWTVESIPNPKEQPSWNYISDPESILQPATKDDVNAILKGLEQRTTDQAAVVIVNSIGKKNARDFATSLFRSWGIGQNDKNNGLLVLLVMDQRRMEFEVGYGLEGKLTDLLCKQIQEDYMVPHAKAGDFDQAVLSGVEQVYAILTGELPGVTDEVNAPSTTAAPLYNVNEGGLEQRPSGGSWLTRKIKNFDNFYVIIICLIFIGFRIAILSKERDPKDFFYAAQSPVFRLCQFLMVDVFLILLFLFLDIPHNLITVIILLYLLLGAIITTSIYWVIHRLKKAEKNSGADELYLFTRQLEKRWKKSGAKKLYPFPIKNYHKFIEKNFERVHELAKAQNLKHLNEKEENKFLSKAQLLEEKLKSADYDVWTSDGTHKVHGLLLQSKYDACPKCSTRAFYVKSDVVTKKSTYNSKGEGVLTYYCKFCYFKKEEIYAIAKLQETRSGSSSGSSSSSWSSSSSSSSSSGSSYGGGSSGGGGAGSSW